MKKILIVCLGLATLCIFTSCAGGRNNGFNVDKLNCMIDLHLHLDGAISIESAKQLAKMQNIKIPESDGELEKIMRVDENCRDLNEFLEKFAFPCSLIQTKEGIRQSVITLAKELKDQGCMYAEIRLAPQKSTDKGLTQEEVVEAAIEGVKASDIDINLILCCMRGNDTHTANIETVNVAEKYLGKGVVAVDLAGAEGLFPTEDYKDVFKLAKEKHIPITIHAGEAAGPESVKTALEIGADRIGHGVRSLEDMKLVKELAEKKIPLELCPTSNINTAIFKSIGKWPLKKLMEAGVYITINTDDPSIENTDIKQEYNKLIKHFNIGKDDVKALLTNSVKASFADDAQKKKMLDKIEENFVK